MSTTNSARDAHHAAEMRRPLDPPERALAAAMAGQFAPFAIRNLSVLAYAQGFTLWHYKGGSCDMARIGADGFFDAAADMLAGGDMIMVSAADGATVRAVAPPRRNASVVTVSLAA